MKEVEEDLEEEEKEKQQRKTEMEEARKGMRKRVTIIFSHFRIK